MIEWNGFVESQLSSGPHRIVVIRNRDGSLTPQGREHYAETFSEAAKKASRFSDYARENRTNYKKSKFNKDKMGYESQEEHDWYSRENARISDRQMKRYKKLAQKYTDMSTRLDSITDEDYKEARDFVHKRFFEDAEYTWYMNPANYKEDKNYEDHD